MRPTLYLPLPRNRFATISRWTTANAVPALLILGLYCWGNVGSRQFMKLTGSRHSERADLGTERQGANSPKWVYIAVPPRQESRLDHEIDSHDTVPAEFAENTFDLQLKTTQISPSRRQAVINNSLVVEGQSTEINGVALRVEAIAVQHVLLSIQGSIVRLPLILATDVAEQFMTTDANVSQPISTTQNIPAEMAATDIR